MNKKLVSVLTCGVLAMGLVGCGSEEKTATNSAPKNEEQTKQQGNTSSTKTVSEESKNGVSLTPEEYIKNYNKVKDRFAKEKVKLLPLEYNKDDTMGVFYTTPGLKREQMGFTHVDYHPNRKDKTISDIQYHGPMEEMSTIQAIVEATGMPWDAEVSQLVESKGQSNSNQSIRKKGWSISAEKSVIGVKVLLVRLTAA
ncbi:hypothetical protein bcgnr5372_38980 [Bacillus luti]|nr:hypothetical protein [Bacillus cereus]HDR8330813.1 hypothetical protein [Bacillus cereus]HDR8337484.1 hypothetical protein [Bacillus cereus]